MTPRLSVLCYYRNESRYLRAMIQSVLDALDQVTEPVEFVLLDNGSTDDSRAIVASFADSRIRQVNFDDDQSGPENDFGHLNQLAFAACQGDLIALIGGDDLCYPDRFRLTLAAFDAAPGIDVVHGSARHIDGNSNLLATEFKALPYHQWNFLRIMFSYCTVAYPTVAIRRSSWQASGGFDVPTYAPDYYLWLKMAARWRYKCLPEHLLYYRVHDQSASHSPMGNARCIAASIQIRTDMRSKYAIEDFFPEIALCSDPTTATAAAYLELGNMMLGGGLGNIQLAFDEYRKADELLPDHPAIVFNVGVILALDGQVDKALEAWDTLEESPQKSAAKLIARGIVRRPFDIKSGREICPELYDRELPPGLWKSDGTLTGSLVRV